MCYPVRREIVLENHMKKKPVTELQKSRGDVCSFQQARDSATPGWPGRGLCAVLTVPALCCLHPTPPDRTPPVQNCKSQRATRQGDRELSSAPAAAGCGAIRGPGTASAAKGSILHSISSLPYVRGAENSKPKLGSRSRFNSSEQQPSRGRTEPSTSSRSSCAVPNPKQHLRVAASLAPFFPCTSAKAAARAHAPPSQGPGPASAAPQSSPAPPGPGPGPASGCALSAPPGWPERRASAVHSEESLRPGTELDRKLLNGSPAR
ncbi:transcription initiation factor TFIID subunit 4-like [Cavia porcellus]|uniref:transcription initiation factor TFIID subunit 4-like n=1 Tax=Cavia porcellus TaxID=10141 RepID=UPI002FE3A286